MDSAAEDNLGSETERNVLFKDKEPLDRDAYVPASRATTNARGLHREASAETVGDKETELVRILKALMSFPVQH
jgi:hypothetical protein